MRALLLELRAALGIDQRGRRIGKVASRIAAGGMPLRLDEDRPAGAEPAQGVVEPAGDGDKFGRHALIEIGPAKPCRALERAVLVEDDALVDQSGPGQEVGETRCSNGDIRRGSSWRDLKR